MPSVSESTLTPLGHDPLWKAPKSLLLVPPPLHFPRGIPHLSSCNFFHYQDGDKATEVAAKITILCANKVLQISSPYAHGHVGQVEKGAYDFPSDRAPQLRSTLLETAGTVLLDTPLWNFAVQNHTGLHLCKKQGGVLSSMPPCKISHNRPQDTAACDPACFKASFCELSKQCRGHRFPLTNLSAKVRPACRIKPPSSLQCSARRTTNPIEMCSDFAESKNRFSVPFCQPCFAAKCVQ